MKKTNLVLKLLIFILTITYASRVWSQSVPAGIIFQAVIKDSLGKVAGNRTVYIKDAIIQFSPGGQVIYSETSKHVTSPDGVITLIIGQGAWDSGMAKLTEINWLAGTYFLNIKAALLPSNNPSSWTPDKEYSDLGTSQFWAVPYALSAGTIEGYEKLVKVSDTTNMLQPYLLKSDTLAIRNLFGMVTNDSGAGSSQPLYLQVADTAAMLAPYFHLYQAAGLEKAIADKPSMSFITSLLNTYYRASKGDSALALKENIANKSNEPSLGSSSQFFPTQYAVKKYVDSSISAVAVKSESLTHQLVDSIKLDDKLPLTSPQKLLGNAGLTSEKYTEISLGAGLIFQNNSLAVDLPATPHVDTFTNDIKVYAVNGIGKYSQGSIIPAKGKTAAQVLLDVLSQIIPPVYIQPTLSISGTPNPGNYEIGSPLTVTLSAVFTANDAGSPAGTLFLKDGSPLPSNSDNIGSLTSTVSYSAKVDYGSGPIKDNNMGTPDPAGRIPAGSLNSGSRSFTPLPKRYWGYSAGSTPTDAEIIAALGGGAEMSVSKIKNSFDIAIPGIPSNIFIAFPTSLGPLNGLRVGNFGSLPAFNLITRPVVNAQGYAQSYNIYVSQNVFSVPVLNIETN